MTVGQKSLTSSCLPEAQGKSYLQRLLRPVCSTPQHGLPKSLPSLRVQLPSSGILPWHSLLPTPTPSWRQFPSSGSHKDLSKLTVTVTGSCYLPHVFPPLLTEGSSSGLSLSHCPWARTLMWTGFRTWPWQLAHQGQIPVALTSGYFSLCKDSSCQFVLLPNVVYLNPSHLEGPSQNLQEFFLDTPSFQLPHQAKDSKVTWKSTEVNAGPWLYGATRVGLGQNFCVCEFGISEKELGIFWRKTVVASELE